MCTVLLFRIPDDRTHVRDFAGEAAWSGAPPRPAPRPAGKVSIKDGLSDSVPHWFNGIASERGRPSIWSFVNIKMSDMKSNAEHDEATQATPLNVHFRLDDKMHGDDQAAANSSI